MPPKRAKSQTLSDMVRTKRTRTNTQTSSPSKQGGSGAVGLNHNLPSPPPPEQGESGLVNPPLQEQRESETRTW